MFQKEAASKPDSVSHESAIFGLGAIPQIKAEPISKLFEYTDAGSLMHPSVSKDTVTYPCHTTVLQILKI